MAKHLFRLLPSRYETKLNWVVVSSLCKGSEQIITRCAVEHLGAIPEVVTPFPLEEYKRRFDEPAALEIFEALKKKSRHIKELNTYDPPKESKFYQDNEQVCYKAMGEMLVDSCEALVVIWNYSEEPGTSGTLQFIKAGLDKGHNVFCIDVRDPTREPVLLRYKKVKGDHADSVNKEIVPVPIPQLAEDISGGYCQLALYQDDAAFDLVQDDYQKRAGIADTSYFDSIKKSSFYDYEVATLAERCRENNLLDYFKSIDRLVLPHYAVANQKANASQKWHQRVSQSLFVLAAIAVTVAVSQVIFFEDIYQSIWLEVAAMALVLAGLGLSYWKQWHEKWIHARYVAEQTRIIAYTLLLGEKPELNPISHALSASKELSFYSGPKDWLLTSVEQILKRARRGLQVPSDLQVIRDVIVRGWLQGQILYHRENKERQRYLHHRSHRRVFWLFGLTLAAAVAHALHLGHIESAALWKDPSNWVTFFAMVMPAWATAFHGINKHMDYERIAGRSEEMAYLLGSFIDRAGRAVEPDDLHEVMREVIDVMSSENYEWCILLSSKPTELAA